jgi:hypothetical protein
MKTTRTAAALAMLLLAVGLIAGCGSDDKDEYADQVVEVITPLSETLTSLGEQLSNSETPDEYADLISESEETIDQGIADLEAITPPEGLEGVNEDLIAAFEGFNESLAEVSAATESGDLAKVEKATLALPEAAVTFQDQLTQIQEDAIDAGVPIEDSEGE